jgi:hypothetical protein
MALGLSLRLGGHVGNFPFDGSLLQKKEMALGRNGDFALQPLIDDLQVPLEVEKLVSRVLETKSE